jgi:lipopolysaccharide biosynthesis glycosyltransferase
MSSACIAFLCDTDYLFATLVCARQARNQSPEGVDIVIFVDGPELPAPAAAKIQSVTGARLAPVPASLIDKIDAAVPPGFFGASHVNRASLFRLFLPDLLDKPYARVMYLDGDMQIRRPLAPLLNAPLAPGQVAATPDWIAYHSREGLPGSDGHRAYLEALGLSEDQYQRYFNAGMVLASAQTWREVGADAFAFLRDHADRCARHDQSALNFVCRNRLSLVSPRWNYLRSYMSLPAYQALDPAIVHFVGRPKPWDGVFAPWTQAEFEPYQRLAADLADLDLAWVRQPLWKRIGYWAQRLGGERDFADDAHRQTINASLMSTAQSVVGHAA